MTDQELKEIILEVKNSTIPLPTQQKIIKELEGSRWIPTTCTVDQVINELEEEKEYAYADFEAYVNDVSPCLDAEYDDLFHRGLERAIKIIKDGGKNDAGFGNTRPKRSVCKRR